MIDDPIVTVHIPPALRPLTRGLQEAMVSGYTVREALLALEREHPGVLPHILGPEGRIGDSVRLFLGGCDVRTRQGLETPLAGEDVLAIVPAG